MNCPFCNNPAKKEDDIGHGQYAWFDCRHCEVSLLTHQTSDRIISHMYHRQIKDKYYAIHADHTVQKLVIGSPTLAKNNVLIECDYPIASITPSNVMQKLHTILLFL